MPVRISSQAKKPTGPVRVGGGPVRVSPPSHQEEHHGGGGIFGAIKRIPGDVGSDLYNAAVGAPAGAYYTGKAVAEDVRDLLEPGNLKPGRGAPHPFERTKKLGGLMAKSTIEDFRHPLRHPGNTALDIAAVASLGAGTAARVGAAGKAIREGETLGTAAKALAKRPVAPPRVFKVGDLEVEHPSSRAALTRGVHRVMDKRMHAKAEANPSGRAAKRLAKKAGKALNEEGRLDEALGKADAAELHAVGKHLKPDEQYALRVVAEEAPLNKRIAATKERIANTRGAERRRHAKRLSLLEGARKHIVDADAKPEFRPEAKKLKAVYGKMAEVAGSREELAKKLGLLDDEAIQTRKTDAGRAAMGAEWTTPAHEAIRKLDKIEARRAELKPTPTVVKGAETVKERPRTHQEAEHRLKALDAALNPLIDEWAGALRAEDKAARKGSGKVVKSKEEFWRDQGAWRKSEADLAPEDRAAEERRRFGYAQGELQGYRHNRPQDPRDMAEEMLSQVSGREPRQKLDLNALLTLHDTLKEQGVDMTKLRKAMDERDRLRDEFRKLEPDVEDLFGGKSSTPKAAPDFGNVRTVEKAPDRVIPGEVTPEAQAELDRMAASEQALLDQAAPDTGRRQPKNVPGQEPIDTLGGPTSPRRVNRKQLIGHEDFEATPGGVYIPDVEQKIGRGGRVSSVGGQGTIGHPRSPIREGYTGAMKRMGREPLKTTRAVAEAKLAVARFQRLVNLRDKLVKAASPEPRFKDDIAIRLDQLRQSEPLPKDVRAFLDEPGAFTPDEADSLFERVRKQKLLAPEDAEEFQRLYDAGKIGWVPKRMLGDLAKPHAPLSASMGKVPVAVADEINNASRIAILFLKPAYATPNIMGNAALNLIQQGFAMPKHLAHASAMQWRLGPENTAKIDTLMHEGFAASLRGEGALPASRLATAGANIWGKGVDRPFRRASWDYEAGRSGFRSPEQIDRLLNDPELHSTLVDVTKRANRQIIDYGRLSHREREVIRRLIFFYPWVKGSTVYAGNMLMEYPAKSAAIAKLGQTGIEKSQEELGPTPSYLAGAFKGPGGGLVNPAAAAILQTPAQAGAVLQGLASGRVPEVAEPSEMLTPTTAAFLNLLAGKNLRTGHEYPRTARGVPQVAFDTLFTQLPEYRLAQQIKGTSHARLFKPSPRAGLMQYLAGGLWPRQYDPSRLHDLAKREQKELSGR